MKLNLIYCKNNQNIIGYDNNLLFTIPEDIKYFKEITSQEYIKGHKNIVIMGYNTWKSIPDKYRPLPNRINIIISTSLSSEESESVKYFTNLNDAIKWTESNHNISQTFIIGGSNIYNEVLENYQSKLVNLYITQILYISH